MHLRKASTIVLRTNKLYWLSDQISNLLLRWLQQKLEQSMVAIVYKVRRYQRQEELKPRKQNHSHSKNDWSTARSSLPRPWRPPTTFSQNNSLLMAWQQSANYSARIIRRKVEAHPRFTVKSKASTTSFQSNLNSNWEGQHRELITTTSLASRQLRLNDLTQ